MGQYADEVAALIVGLLLVYKRNGHPGVVNTSQCRFYIFAEDPKKYRIPDAAFTQRGRLAGGRSNLSIANVAPELIVEVISPNDLVVDLFNKIADYLGAGVPLVWAVIPEIRTVFVYRADRTGLVLGPEDMIDCGEALPGFRCRVTELFE